VAKVILNKCTYHIHEISISGSPGCGKSTLIKKIVSNLSLNYQIYFETNSASALDQKFLALDYDFALIEQRQTSPLKTILFWDENNQNTITENIIALISNKPTEHLIEGRPCFHPDNIEGIQNFILETLVTEAHSMPLNALILAGGKSQRMGQDKAQIEYHHESQGQYLAKLLSPYCSNVFFSCRKEQQDEAHLQGFPQIHDQFLNIGPVGGILSYFQQYHSSRLLVVACDMPFIDHNSVQQLIDQLDPFKLATVFENTEKKWPEPLFAIYHPKSQARFFQLMGLGQYCPMKTLFNSKIKKVIPHNSRIVLNGNTPEELLQLKQQIKESTIE
jgi:molybdopterin-guanine dinucleotide biosynthesis protein A/molybdopterin-guanine dinucleotide biosynthesis protein